MARRKVKRRYEVPPGTYRVEWDNVNPSGESYVDFEYMGGSWSNFDDAWMDVVVANAGPKVTQDGEKMGEMYQFAAEALGKDSCCCGATKENPCECMIQGIMQCSATCPCSSKKYSAEDAEDYGVQPAWMAENTSDLDYANLTDWANANDSDDMKYLVGGFFGGVLSTIIGAIAGEWTIQKLKGKGLL